MPSQTGKIALRIFNGLAPKSLGKTFSHTFDFTASAAPQNFDLRKSRDEGKIEWVQCVYIDNSLNTSSLSVAVVSGSNQTITAPPLSQGYYPILATEPNFTISTAGAFLVKIQFLNIMMPSAIWFVSGSGGGGGGGGGVGTFRQVSAGTADAATVADINGTVAWNSASAAGKTETLPTFTTAASTITIVDEIGTANAYNIVINAAAGQTINNLASVTLVGNGESVTLQYDGISNLVII